MYYPSRIFWTLWRMQGRWLGFQDMVFPFKPGILSLKRITSLSWKCHRSWRIRGHNGLPNSDLGGDNVGSSTLCGARRLVCWSQIGGSMKIAPLRSEGAHPWTSSTIVRQHHLDRFPSAPQKSSRPREVCAVKNPLGRIQHGRRSRLQSWGES